tara:strand:+ start:253 stop:1215 length:963 start_codon:yes stop_codon:yes gene_type:complete
MIDYSIFYKEELPIDGLHNHSWDIFISAFNSSDRVNHVFDHITASKKFWLIQPDYQFNETELPPSGEIIAPNSLSEAEFVKQVVAAIGIENFQRANSVCIDITGFIKPYMMAFLWWLQDRKCSVFDVLYSEPDRYAKKEKTQFSGELISCVKQINGYAGQHRSDTTNDYLLVGSGYDDNLISHVAEDKANTKKIQMFGFPSLRPDMYQENILRAHRASESVDSISLRNRDRVLLAPANDPFATATTISSFVERENRSKEITNLYLSPLATKPQALGFALYYLSECHERAVSMIYPFSETHSQETSKGISRIWKYTIEFED